MASSQQGTELPNIKLSTTDPTVGDGVPGIPNQLLIRTDTNEIYFFRGPLDTNWSKVGSGGGGGIDIENSGAALGTFSILNLLGVSAVDAGGGQADLALAPGNYIVWRAGQTWASVYAQIVALAGQPAVVLVQRDGGFRTITKEVAGATSLWNVWFIADPGDELFTNIVHIKTESELTLGLDPNGLAMLQSTNIKWEFQTAVTPVVTGAPVRLTISGARVFHNGLYAFVTDSFWCSLDNEAELLGTGGTALVRLTGAAGSGNRVKMKRGANIGNSSFVGLGGPHVLTIDTYGDFENISGAAFGAGVTDVYSSRLHLMSPNGTLWTVEVSDAGVLVVS